ncbi:iron ABC transporter permease [soil metagenome]
MTSLRRAAVGLTLAALPLVVLAVFFVGPVTAMISRGFDGGIGPVVDVLTRPRTVRVAWFTLWTSTVATAISLLVGLPAAYALHRLRWPGRQWVRAGLLVPFVLPTVVVGVAFGQLLRSGPLQQLDATPAAIVAGLVFFNAAVVIRVVGTAWEDLDPRPAQAAATLGANSWTVLRTVTLPMLRGAVASAALVVFLYCATAFGVVLLLGGVRYSSIETEIYLLTVNYLDLQAAAALSLLQLAVVVVLLVVLGRVRTPVVSRVRSLPRRPRLVDLPSLAATVLLLVLVAIPIAALVVGSLRHDGAWSLVNWRQLEVTDALTTSLRTAVDATWISVLLGVLIAVVVTRPTRGRTEPWVLRGLDAAFMVPLGVSAVTLGFGFLVGLPLGLRDSVLLIPIAQALVALPLVVRVLEPVLAGVDDRQRQAAATLGAGPVRAFVTVDLATLRRPLVVASGFAFAISMGEFGATSFLARDDSLTLPVLIQRQISHPGEFNYGTSLAAACVLGLVVAAVMGAAEILGRGRTRVAA